MQTKMKPLWRLKTWMWSRTNLLRAVHAGTDPVNVLQLV